MADSIPTLPGRRVQDLTGQTFGRLTVQSFAWMSQNAKAMWLCRCECGNGKVILGASLRGGKVVSCGCYRIDIAKERYTPKRSGRRYGKLVVLHSAGHVGPAHYWLCRCDCSNVVAIRGSFLTSGNSTSCGCSRRIHLKCDTPEYRAWAGMKGRCHNPKSKQWHRYGGRGIKVCDKWRESFKDFLADVGPRPSRFHSMDRIDNDGDYEPGNCRWATNKEQSINRSSSRFLTFQGTTLTVTEWANRLGMKQPTLSRRIIHGWSTERALTTPEIR